MEWMDNLPETMRDNESLKKFDSVEALATSYTNLESLKGNSIRIVGPDASDDDRAETYQKVMKHMPELILRPNPDNAEQMKEFHQMLGVPDELDGYSGEGIDLNDQIMGELRQLAKDTNMSKAQWNKYIAKMNEMQSYTTQQKEDTRTRMGAELKTEWGMAFEDRYAVVEKHLAENPDLGSIDQMTPEQIRGHYSVARSLTGVAQAHNQPAPTGKITPAEALSQLTEVRNNPLFMDGYSNMPEHKRLVAKSIELMQLADPSRYA